MLLCLALDWIICFKLFLGFVINVASKALPLTFSVSPIKVSGYIDARVIADLKGWNFEALNNPVAPIPWLTLSFLCTCRGNNLFWRVRETKYQQVLVWMWTLLKLNGMSEQFACLFLCSNFNHVYLGLLCKNLRWVIFTISLLHSLCLTSFSVPVEHLRCMTQYVKKLDVWMRYVTECWFLSEHNSSTSDNKFDMTHRLKESRHKKICFLNVFARGSLL